MRTSRKPLSIPARSVQSSTSSQRQTDGGCETRPSASLAPTTTSPFTFAFDSELHQYVDDATGTIYPHITGLLKDAGETDDRWYTEESRERGHQIHLATARYDYGSYDREDVIAIHDGQYKGWLQAHVDAMDIIRPRWDLIEVPIVHAVLRFGGRPDRCGTVYGALANVELKSGDPEDFHAIQTALQNLLLEQRFGLPAETIPRYGLYLKRSGRWHLQSFPNVRKDFQKARDIVRRFA